MFLPAPAREVVRPRASVKAPKDLKERLAVAKGLVDLAEKRLDTVRSKATSLGGFVAILTPILSWWLLTGRERIGTAPFLLMALVYALIAISATSLAICLRALFRSQSIASYQTLDPSLFINLEKGELRTHDWAGELIGQLAVWGDVQRWADIVADYFRAGQRFLGISLVTAVLAGAVSYIFPQTTHPVTPPARPGMEIGFVAPIESINAPANIPFGYLGIGLAGVLLGGIGMFCTARSLYRRRIPPAPQKVPECQNIVQLTPAAAAKVRENMWSEPGKYLRISVWQVGNEQPSLILGVTASLDPELDFLGETEGVQIAISRKVAGMIGRPTIDWEPETTGNPGFFSFLT